MRKCAVESVGGQRVQHLLTVVAQIEARTNHRRSIDDLSDEATTAMLCGIYAFTVMLASGCCSIPISEVTLPEAQTP